VAAARCSSGGAVHLDLTGLSICTNIGTEKRSSVDKRKKEKLLISRLDTLVVRPFALI
jgi:hypothetical protein